VDDTGLLRVGTCRTENVLRFAIAAPELRAGDEAGRVTHRRNMMASVRPVTLAELCALLTKADDIAAAAGYTKVGQE
jgi:hypothetical protein